MRCANCGNELKAGSLYCDVCGHPVQIVPDYNEFDDYLDNLVGMMTGELMDKRLQSLCLIGQSGLMSQ